MSEQWHDDHKKAIAEKWVQCPQISARKQELLSKWAIGQVGINALCEAHAHAEKELAELKADRVAISQKLSDALDALFASNKQLAEANRKLAERINDDQRYLVAPLCNAEKALDDCQAELAEARAEIERLKVWLNETHERDLTTIQGHASTIDKRDAEIERKDKLIEQMREALRLALPEARSTHCEQTILAALAAERGE